MKSRESLTPTSDPLNEFHNSSELDSLDIHTPLMITASSSSSTSRIFPNSLPMNLNSSHFPTDQHPFALSSSSSCHNFFGSTRDHAGYFHRESYYQKDENYGYDDGGSSTYEIKNMSSALKLTLWKKEDDHQIQRPAEAEKKKMKKKTNSKVEVDQKVQPSSSLETDLSSNSSSYNCNSPIRVCSDCHTTKTPLWRSGPNGPKSLCNACGIRQRKARRAMAAAAAAGNGTAVVSNNPTPAILKIKLKQKEKMGKNNSQMKKRSKICSGSGSSSDNGQKKIGFEDFLINLSNDLSIHRVFPQDEKDAAILLMALSSGLVHG